MLAAMSSHPDVVLDPAFQYPEVLPLRAALAAGDWPAITALARRASALGGVRPRGTVPG